MTRVIRRSGASPDLADWLRSIGVLREDGRTTVPILDRCASCRAATGCGECPGCQAGDVCHRLPPCPRCGAVQTIPLDRLVRHPLHQRLYGELPENELFRTSNGALFLQSVAAMGIIEPILGLEAEEDDETGARPGQILVLSGWRRVLAAQACSFPTVPVRLVDPAALPRRADTDLLIVSANLQRQKTIDEIRAEVQVWKRAIAQASVRPPKAWEIRAVVAQVMGISVRTVQQLDAEAAVDRLTAAQRRLELRAPGLKTDQDDADLADDDLSIVERLRLDQQPGDLRGTDILSALTERDEPLLSPERDEVVHESLGRAAQTAEGASILDVADVAPLWPEDSRSEGPAAPGTAAVSAEWPIDPTAASSAPSQEAMQVGPLTIHRGPPNALPFAELPAVDLIIAAPSWIEPLVRPLLTPAHLPFARDWEQWLARCLQSWRRAIRPGGRLLLIVPISTPLHPGLPVLQAAVEGLQATDWAIGGTLVLDDPGLHGPLYAVPHADRVLPPKGPARLILAAAPIPPEISGSAEERARQAWDLPLPGALPREVATVEEAALSHLWRYAGPGRRSRWLPEFQPGLLYHLIRIFSRPDALVFLPELGGPNLVRGCLRTGRQIVALAQIAEQVTEVIEKVRPSTAGRPGAVADRDFLTDSLRSVTGAESPRTDDD